MKANYCPCKNTYTINNCNCEKKGRMYYSALPNGIGSLVGQGNSNINQVTNERTITNDSNDDLFV